MSPVIFQNISFSRSFNLWCLCHHPMSIHVTILCFILNFSIISCFHFILFSSLILLGNLVTSPHKNFLQCSFTFLFFFCFIFLYLRVLPFYFLPFLSTPTNFSYFLLIFFSLISAHVTNFSKSFYKS